MSEPKLLEIDGSVMEGGGQILRISVSLSAILGIPVKISKIRASRSRPGLAKQHLTGLQLVAEMCQAKLLGATLGSTQIEFWPSKIRGGHYVADIQTAGSISLLLQVALPCALFADGEVSLELRGGTNADMAPQLDYMTTVLQPVLRKFNADFEIKMFRRGFFPKGGGLVKAWIRPARALKSINVTERGDVTSISGVSFVAGNLSLQLARLAAEGARGELQHLGPVNIDVYREPPNFARDNGNSIMLSCVTSRGCVLGADAIGGRGRDARDLGRQAGRALRDDINSGACLDTHGQDQVIIYMALSEGRSAVRVGEVTLHTSTAIHIAQLIAKVKFEIRQECGQNLIECTGLGFVNQYMR